MNDNYHLLSDGELKRNENTLVFRPYEGSKDHIPIKSIEALFIHGQVEFNSRLVSFLDKHTIEMHMFNYSGVYNGSYVPTAGQSSGSTIVKQVDAYQHPAKRMNIAKEFVLASIHNMRKNAKYYNCTEITSELSNIANKIEEVTSIEELMGVEAEAKKCYYELFRTQTPDKFTFETREYNPPNGEINALLSYVYALLYSSTTSAIRSTALDPKISYLHETADRRNSLCLDIADMFKPVIADRLVFRLLNKGQIKKTDFDDSSSKTLLADDANKKVLTEYEKTLEQTIEHPDLNRNVSYQYLLQLESYKLKKHLLTGEEYVGFKRWW